MLDRNDSREPHEVWTVSVLEWGRLGWNVREVPSKRSWAFSIQSLKEARWVLTW